VTWVVDGTTEPETAVFFGIEEATHGLFLGSWKIPSENVEDLVPCFRQAADQFGWPDDVLHDLSPTISGACEHALRASPIAYATSTWRAISAKTSTLPQAALCKRLRTLKLQYRLKEQRGTERVAPTTAGLPADLVLAEVLAGRTVVVSGMTPSAARSCWPSTSGFSITAVTAAAGLPLIRICCTCIAGWCGPARPSIGCSPRTRCGPHAAGRSQLPSLLQAYRTDPEICAAAEQYERCWGCLRDSGKRCGFRPTTWTNYANRRNCRRTSSRLSCTRWQQLRQELQQQTAGGHDPDRPLAKIVLAHLDKYWNTWCRTPYRPRSSLGSGPPIPWKVTGARSSDDAVRHTAAASLRGTSSPCLKNTLWFGIWRTKPICRWFSAGSGDAPRQAGRGQPCSGSFDAWRRPPPTPPGRTPSAIAARRRLCRPSPRRLPSFLPSLCPPSRLAAQPRTPLSSCCANRISEQWSLSRGAWFLH